MLPQEGQEVIVKDGAQIVTVHAFRVSKAPNTVSLTETPNTPAWVTSDQTQPPAESTVKITVQNGL